MKVLVIGGTGLTGTPLAHELAEQGHELVVVSRGERPALLPAAASHLRVDVNDGIETLLDVEPEIVVDMIAMRGRHAHRIAAFEGIARRAVVTSSGDVYRAFGRVWRTEPGDPLPLPLTESAPLRRKLEPTGEEYDKVGLERTLRSADIPVTVLRLPAVHGPGDRQSRLWPYLRRIIDHRPIVLPETLAGWRWTRGFCDNVAHAIALAVTDDAAAGRTYNVGDEPILSEREWVEATARMLGASPRLRVVPDGAYPRWGQWDFRQHYVLDTTAIRRELGYQETVPLDEGIRRTLDWQRAHPAESDWFGDYDADDAALSAAAAAGS